MIMDKNLLFAIVLSSLVVLVFLSPQYQKRFGKSLPDNETTEQVQPGSPILPRNGTGITTPQTSPDVKPNKPETEIPDSLKAQHIVYTQVSPPASERIITLENSDIRILVSSKGGAVTGAFMKRYNGRTKEERAQLITDGETWYDGTISADSTTISLGDIIFHVTEDTGTHAVLTAELTGGKQIIREFTLDSDGFILSASTTLDDTWNDPVLYVSWHGPINDTEEPVKQIRIWPLTMLMRDDTTLYNKAAFLGQGERKTVNGSGKEKTTRIYSNEGSQKIEIRKMNSGRDYFNGDLDWYAIRNKYFMSAAIPKERMRWSAAAAYSMAGDRKWYDFTVSKRLSDGNTDLDIYIGPISYDILKSTGPNLTQIMELSWKFIRPISIAFLWLMKKLHAFIPNWGLVLVAFSVIIKILLYPLSHKSIVSMRRMSSLQPQISALREKHKNNPQKLNQATMELYRKEGVNPFSGCLPVLLQMPVFFALYPVVGRAFELRQAMFIPRWIEDLSRPDPYYILPVAMGLSMFFQQKTTMTDPNQKAMLYIMPVMMVILFANFSAGLTLYWFLFNVMSYLQQEIHTPRTAAT